MPTPRSPGQLSSLALGALLALGWLTASGGAIALVTLTEDSYEEYPVDPGTYEPTETFLPTHRTTTRTPRSTTRRTTPTTTRSTTTDSIPTELPSPGPPIPTTTGPFGGGIGGAP